jgi:hypothetical protein
MVTATRVKAGVTAPSARRAAHHQRSDPPELVDMTVPRAEILRSELPDLSALRVARVLSARRAPSARRDHPEALAARTPTT